MDSFSSFEKTSGRTGKKAIVLLLRWVLVIACSGLLLSSAGFWDKLFSSDAAAPLPLSTSLTIILLFTSNIVVSLLPSKWFGSRCLDITLAIVDVSLVSFAIWINEGLSSEMFVLYFICLMVAAAGETLKSVVLCSILIAAGYTSLAVVKSGPEVLTEAEFLVRLPFLFVVAIFFGYFSELAKRERAAVHQYKQKLEVANRVRSIVTQLNSSLNPEEILDALADSAREFCRADYVAVISRDPESVISHSAEQKSPLQSSAASLSQTQVSQSYCGKAELAILEELLKNPTNLDLPSIDRDSSVFRLGDLSTNVLLSRGRNTFIPFSGDVDSNLFLLLVGNLSAELLGYASLIVSQAQLSLDRCEQHLELQREFDRRRDTVEDLSRSLSFNLHFVQKVSQEFAPRVEECIGSAELLASGAYGRLNDEQRNTVHKSLNSLRDLSALVRKVSNSSEVDFGQQRLILSARDPLPVFHEFIQAMSEISESRSVELKLIVSEALPEVRSDWDLVRQIFDGLMMTILQSSADTQLACHLNYLRPSEELEIQITSPDKLSLGELFEVDTALWSRQAESLGGTLCGYLQRNQRIASNRVDETLLFTLRIPSLFKAEPNNSIVEVAENC